MPNGEENIPISRRRFLWGCAATSLITNLSVLHAWGAERHVERFRGPAHHALSLNHGWIFEGKVENAAMAARTLHAVGKQINLPHTETPLSWRDWNPETWEYVWGYRRQFVVPEDMHGLRLFLHFERVMEGTSPVLNGHALPEHLGGFLPFEYEITNLVKKGENQLAVAVDSRWLQVPPTGSPRGPKGMDYLVPGGINGAVTLRAVPQIYIRSVFAKPMNVLDGDRRLDVICQLDAAGKLPANARLHATLWKNGNEIAGASTRARVEHPEQEISLTLDKLGNIQLWDTDHPEMYDVEVTLFVEDKPLHRYKTRTGFRDARFEVDGFFLNGAKLNLFGLNRHELYPYFGFAASNRTMRHDAVMLRRQLNCNMVRCSHYPQSEAFMDACDDLGLMVWEETPGWDYVGGEKFQELVVRDVHNMVLRDRNHPSVIIWGVRVNESHNDPPLYKKTRDIALALDGTRQTSGSMTVVTRRTWKTEWHQDVFAYDDYQLAAPGEVGIAPPLPGVPYLVTEAVGQLNYILGRANRQDRFGLRYMRTSTPQVQQDQALFHAQAHDKAAGYKRISGLLGWCAFDYPSNGPHSLKCPGVADIFRLPKLGASYYQSQVDPRVRPVIAPDFYWDFGSQMPNGPGESAPIFSNCERLELFVGGKHHSVLHPDREKFPNTRYPPFFANLKMDGDDKPELEIRGYMGEKMVLSRSFSSDPSDDKLWFMADDAKLQDDGSDSTRLAFGVADKYGAPRAFGGGTVTLKLEGPGIIVGTNPFDLKENGGMAAVWIRTLPGKPGIIRVHASHSALPSPEDVIIHVEESA